ncbi:hypothetical protein IHE44_0002974, partial [Lamprotornis superbus]
ATPALSHLSQFPPADPSVSPLSPSSPQCVHLTVALELPAQPRLPALLRDGFLPCRDPAELVPGPAGALVVATDLVPNGDWISTSSWCCWKPPPARGQLQLPGGARQPGAPPEPALGHGPDPTVRGECCPQQGADGDRGLRVGLRLPGAGPQLLPVQEGAGGSRSVCAPPGAPSPVSPPSLPTEL